MGILSDKPYNLPNISDWFKVSIHIEGFDITDWVDWCRIHFDTDGLKRANDLPYKALLGLYRNALRSDLLDLYIESPNELANWHADFYRLFLKKIANCWNRSLTELKLHTESSYINTPHMKGSIGPYPEVIKIECDLAKQYHKEIIIDLEPKTDIIDKWFVELQNGSIES